MGVRPDVNQRQAVKHIASRADAAVGSPAETSLSVICEADD
ncbi:MAG: hypothetical protein WA902_07320 [Thermosynechococcaceae cyanobacterium]